MEKFNAIKLLEEEKKNKDLFNRNLNKETFMKKVYCYVDTYIDPLLKEMIYQYEIDEDMFGFLIIEATNIVNDLALFDNKNYENDECDLEDLENNDINEIVLNEDDDELLNEDEIISLTDDEIDFLNKDKKIKKQVANKICEFIISEIK